MKGNILVVDDQVSPRHVLACELENAGYAVVEAGDGDEGWARFCDDEPDLVITDLVMPRCDGHDLLCRIRNRSDVPVIVLSAQTSFDTAVRVLKAGADDFVASNTVDLPDLVDRAGDAVVGRRGYGAGSELERRFGGTSDAIARVRSRIAGLAPLAHPVLVLGEEGTGKSTVVRALHELGSTARGALVRIDCSSWESKRGLPRAAAVHLDRVEQLTPGSQAFWSDVLGGRARVESGRIPRVLASAGPLFGAPDEDGFHTGLIASLSRFPIELPALRERPEDVGPIADAIVGRLASAMGRTTALTPSSRALLAGRRWRGNVKQLERLLERAVAFTTVGPLEAGLLAELMGELEDGLGAIRRRRVQRERDALIDALERTGGNVSRTAEVLGRSRGAVYRLLEKHGVSIVDSR